MTQWPWLKRRARSHLNETALPTVWIVGGVIERTLEVLLQSGSKHQPHEGVAYWAGRRSQSDCFVMACIAPASLTTRGSFNTSSASNAIVIMQLAEANLELLAQVHSHPGSLVDHSDGDDDRALMPYEGFLSIVVPHYGREGMTPLALCGVHVFQGERFRRLTDHEIERQFHVVEEFADLRKGR